MDKKFKCSNETGSAVLENVIVLPIVFIVILIVVLMLMISYDKAVLDSAVQRGALQAKKMIEDPQIKTLIENQSPASSTSLDVGDLSMLGDKSTYNDIKPYRYFFMNEDSIEKITVERVDAFVDHMDFFSMSKTSKTTAEVDNAIVYIGIEVKSEKKYDLPFDDLGFPVNDLKISSRAYAVANDPDEFIRNIDLAYEILEDVGIAGDDGEINKMFTKVKSMLGKFFKK